MSCQKFCCALALALAFFCRGPLGSTARAAARDVDDDAQAESDGSQDVIGWVMPNSAHLNAGARFSPTGSSGIVHYNQRPPAGMQIGYVAPQNSDDSSDDVGSSDEPNRLSDLESNSRAAIALNSDRPKIRRGAARTERPVRRASAQDKFSDPFVEETPTVADPSTARGTAETRSQRPSELIANPAPASRYHDDGHGDLDVFGDGDDCGGCNLPSCPTCCQACGMPGTSWVRAEYLYWFTQGMHIPALVTSGPTAAQPGYLGEPGTQILFGDTGVNGYGRSGGRITVGTWLNPCHTVGIEGDYFALSTASTNFTASSNGNPILSRPFFEVAPIEAQQFVGEQTAPSGQTVEQVALPGSVAGSVSVATSTRFQGAGLRMLFNLCCCDSCYTNCQFPGLSGPGGYRVDFLLGYRYLQLADTVGINENLTSLNPDQPGTFFVNDSFATRNVFNGLELGTSVQSYRGRWSVQWISKLALGFNSETVNINGSTTTDSNGAISVGTGGLLALSSNIGTYRRNEFAVVPELGVNLGYSITPRLRALVGYNFIYWSQVVRAGEQINLNVNSTLLPGYPTNYTGPLGDQRQPSFAFHDTTFWAQGLSAGIEFRW